MEQHWDKRITGELLKLGLNREQAGAVIGIIAEERQIADLNGYKRGFNSGYENAEEKLKK